MKSFRRRKAGFSLLESLIAVTILGLVSTAIVTSSFQFSKYAHSLSLEADFHRQVRWMDGRLRNDLRMTAASTLPTAGTLQLTDADGTTVTYQLLPISDTEYRLVRQEGATMVELMPRVSAWSFKLPTVSDPYFSIELSIRRSPNDRADDLVKLTRVVMSRAKIGASS